MGIRDHEWTPDEELDDESGEPLSANVIIGMVERRTFANGADCDAFLAALMKKLRLEETGSSALAGCNSLMFKTRDGAIQDLTVYEKPVLCFYRTEADLHVLADSYRTITSRFAGPEKIFRLTAEVEGDVLNILRQKKE